MSASPIRKNACPRCGEELASPAERRRFEAPERFVLLCLGFSSFGAAIGLFAAGSWAWGIVLLLVAGIFLTALCVAERRGQAAAAAEVWRTRLGSTIARWHSRSRLDALDVDRRPALRALGEAVWRADTTAEQEARLRLVGIEEERKRVEDELAVQLAGAEERIRRARLPVGDTVILTPAEAGSDPSRPDDE